MAAIDKMLAKYGESITLKRKTSEGTLTPQQQAQGVTKSITYTDVTINAYVKHLTEREILALNGKYSKDDVYVWTKEIITVNDEFTWQGKRFRVDAIEKKHKAGNQLFLVAIGLHINA